MQLSDIRTEVRYRAGVDSNDAMAGDAVVTAFINSAVREVANMRDWDWNKASETITTVAGTATYSRNAAARTTTRVENTTDNYLLRSTTPKAAARWAGRTTAPLYWYVEAGQLVLVPTPAAAVNIKHTYLAAETPLVTDFDEPSIPDYAIDLVIIKAAMKLAARMDNTSMHRLLAQDERAAVDSLRDDARRAKGSPRIDAREDWTGRVG